MTEPTVYRLAAMGRREAEDERLSLLEEIFDPLSRQRRAFVQPGWRCLEVGAGRGSMAVWLAQRVGVTGRVVATDVDTTYLNRLDLPNLEVRRHDILSDSLDILDPGSFDLVCARLLLFWLAGKQEVAIRRMVECLRPGGWLIDEDGDWGMVAPIDPSHSHYALYHRAWKNGEWWVSRGYDPTFGRKLPMLFERCGLVNIRHKASAAVVRGGSPWGRWWLQSLEAIRASEQTDGCLTEERDKEYGVLTAPLTDPSFWFLNALIHACWGPTTSLLSLAQPQRSTVYGPARRILEEQRRRDIPNRTEGLLGFGQNVPEYLSGAGLEISSLDVGIAPEGHLK